MIPYFTGSQLRDALAYPALIDSLRVAFQEITHSPTRHVHHLSTANASSLLLMPAWQTGGNLGVKLVTVVPANRAKNIPTVNSIFMLLDASTGVPLAIFDGEELTLRRTAAASALASDYLSRTDSNNLLVVGAGRLASYMAAAHCAVRPLRTIHVWGRSPSKAQDTVRNIQAQGLPPLVDVMVAPSLEAAVRSADIITCATTSTEPIVRGDWVRPGTHIDLVGGFKPNMREADDSLMAKALVFVDTFSGALTEAGDLIAPMANGSLRREAIVAELADLSCGRHAGRSDDGQVTVFKSVGSAIEDLAAANLAWSMRQAQLENSR